jgi:hypothetical protein
MLALRNASAGAGHVGWDVAVEDRNAVAMLAQDAGGEKAGNAAADDNRVAHG